LNSLLYHLISSLCSDAMYYLTREPLVHRRNFVLLADIEVERSIFFGIIPLLHNLLLASHVSDDNEGPAR
jgi:hypothetical protein